jgi:predicted nucleotidyltransferase
MTTAEDLIRDVTSWSLGRRDIRALVLVGSHARGVAGPESDIDLVILSEQPTRLVTDSAWTRTFGTVIREAREDWGRLISLRVWYVGGPEVEFGITDVQWAHRDDETTLAVLRGGARVLFDRDGLLEFLQRI